MRDRIILLAAQVRRASHQRHFYRLCYPSTRRAGHMRHRANSKSTNAGGASRILGKLHHVNSGEDETPVADPTGGTRVSRARIAVVITTMGRWERVERLLNDLSSQTYRPDTVVIAFDDGPDAAAGLGRLLGNHNFAGLNLRTVRKSGGYSVGCNQAVDLLSDSGQWLCFLTDSCRVEADFLDRVSRRCVPPATVCAWRLVDDEGDRNILPPAGSELTRRNVWSAVVPAMAMRLSDYRAVGGFDPSIGTGAETPWQSGDETDLLLRLSKLADFSITWVDDITVEAHTEFSHLDRAQRRRKLRTYGRGTGYIYRRWNYSAWDKLLLLAGAASAPMRRPAKFRPGDGLALLIGRAEGIAGRKFTRDTDDRAVLG